MLEAIGALVIVAVLVLLAWDASNGNVLRWGRIGGTVAFVLLMFWLGLNCGAAFAQHHHPDATIEDPKVAKFYETWTRPPQRSVSCCNMKDCYAAQVRRGPNGLEYLHKWSNSWAKLPSHLIEHNQTDPRESPNTENHICANEMFPDIVYCAVLADGS